MKPIVPAKVIEILQSIPDPQSGKSIVEMQMVEDLQIKGDQVNFKILLPSLGVGYKSDLNFSCIAKISEAYPHAQVNVHMAVKTTQQKVQSALPQVKNIIAVASGKGGVGKSTVAANLAIGLAKDGSKVGLIDADLYGPSMPTMFGLEGHKPNVSQVGGTHKLHPLEAHGVYVMSIGFIIEPEQAVVLRGPRLGGIIKQFINDCLWPDLDYLVIDLPPGTGDIQLTLVQTVPVTGAIVVTTPQKVAVADALKAYNMFTLPNVNVPVLGIVENMSWFTPEELPNNKYHIFGEGGGQKLADKNGVPLLAQLPLIQSVREQGDAGSPVILNEDSIAAGYMNDMAVTIKNAIDKRNRTQAATETVTMMT